MDTYTCEYVEDKIIESPYYCNHKRSKNWVAKIEGKNSLSFTRDFLRMRNYKFSIEELKVGDALELGAEYYNCRGKSDYDRRYVTVKEISEDSVIFEIHSSLAKALKASNDFQKVV